MRNKRKARFLFLVCSTSLATVVFILFNLDTPFFTEFQEEVTEFLVNSPACRIPKLDPFHRSILPYLHDECKISCENGDHSITYSRGSTLFYDEQLLFKHIRTKSFLNVLIDKLNYFRDHFSKIKDSQIFCCYRPIHRVEQSPDNYDINSDRKYRIEEDCVPIIQNETTIHEDSILVQCSYDQKIVYKNVHFLIQKMSLDTQDSTKLNVIISGIDSISNLNFQRNFKKTKIFLKNHINAVEFSGFNKVRDNTFPNMLAVLSGLDEPELWAHSCVKQYGDKLDDCPWIWKEYKQNGYITTMLEDSSEIGMFHFNMPGFVKKPFDHYGRPGFMAAENEIGKETYGYSVLCLGPKLSVKAINDYALDFEIVYQNTPHFGLFWTASLSHDFMGCTGKIDDLYAEYLRELDTTGFFNRSVFLFLSDHGLRFGRIRSTYVGMLEERLPFVYLAFPDWFKNKYNSAYSNILLNTKRLVSNFDLHETLLDILHQRYSNESHVNFSVKVNQRGISLFQKIPYNRTCREAGIEQHYCTCNSAVSYPTNLEITKMAANSILNKLNKELQGQPTCAQFNKVTVDHSWKFDLTLPSHDYGLKTTPVAKFLLQVTLGPGGVKVESSVLYNNLDESFQVSGEISRINKYGNQSHCIKHEELRKFCVCKDLMT